MYFSADRYELQVRFLFRSVILCLILSLCLTLRVLGSPSVSYGLRIFGDSERFRLLVDFDGPVDYRALLVDNPRRLVIDLPLTLFELGDDSERLHSSLVSSVRYGAFGSGSRLVLDLISPVMIVRDSFGLSGSHHRLIIDLRVTDSETFSGLSVTLPDSADSFDSSVVSPDAPDASDASDSSVYTVVLDPGHGGIDGGAVGSSLVVEKDVTLLFSELLRDRLSNHPRIDVILTRSSDRFVSLTERLMVARRSAADLFISVHADSLHRGEIRGATLYTLSADGSDDLSRRLARRENRSDLLAGLDLPEMPPLASDILIDLTRRETESFSVRFARLAIDILDDHIRLIGNPHRSADFFVLRSATTPSVLFELGYLSNVEDEQLLGSRLWLYRTSGYLASSIFSFFGLTSDGG